jgi:hypothetical protein
MEIVFVVANQRTQLHLVKTGRTIGDAGDPTRVVKPEELLEAFVIGAVVVGQPVEVKRCPVHRPTVQPGKLASLDALPGAFIDLKLTPLVVITSIPFGSGDYYAPAGRVQDQSSYDRCAGVDAGIQRQRG